jgi:hypothetical protein
MTEIELDRARLEALALFNQTELREITVGVIRGASDALVAIAAGIETGDLAAVAQAAHRGRNEALVVGARDLDRAFGSIEVAARVGQLHDLLEAAKTIQAVWSRTRVALERMPSDVLP